ncbi:MAG: C40 family peptidase [Clostridiales bacterium]|jgi:hypothetical protein|nr:C40 family peptidase [Clostridiales bacterium]
MSEQVSIAVPIGVSGPMTGLFQKFDIILSSKYMPYLSIAIGALALLLLFKTNFIWKNDFNSDLIITSMATNRDQNSAEVLVKEEINFELIKSNTGLVEYVNKALSEKWRYAWGGYGQKATDGVVESLVRQYPIVNTIWREYMMGAVMDNTRLSDCFGLVKGYLFTDKNETLIYNKTYDVNTALAYNRAEEKGVLSTMPDIPGVILYKKGHVGIYCGEGLFIEMLGHGVGMREGGVSNGKITSGSEFTNWFKDVNITYEQQK